jgi:hypothetical protein
MLMSQKVRAPQLIPRRVAYNSGQAARRRTPNAANGCDRGSPDGHWSEPFFLWLKSYRIAAGLSRSQLAERSGVTLNVLGYYERGHYGQPRRSSI